MLPVGQTDTHAAQPVHVSGVARFMLLALVIVSISIVAVNHASLTREIRDRYERIDIINIRQMY